MAYTVKKLAEISGISVRTLHFYDEIGLLQPAYVGDNGYRFYEEEQLLMLQQILFFKELGFQLNDIHKIIQSSDFDKIETLQSHRKVLQQQLQRTHQLTETIDKTIAKLKGQGTMSDQEMYLGFDKNKQEEYERYIADHYGKEAVQDSKKKIKNWTKSDYEHVKQEYDAIHTALTQAMQRHESHSSEPVQTLIRQHFSLVSKFWTPSKESYVGLGQLYLQHEDFRKLYESYHPQLAAFLADAMKVFAESELTDVR